MTKIRYDINNHAGEWRDFDGNTYVIQNGNVFLFRNGKYVYTKEITESQLKIYGREKIEPPSIFELKVLNINERKDGSALIKAEDGNGLEIVFKDVNYSKRRENYQTGKKGKYNLFATVFNEELPEEYANGICLKGKDAEKWFKWTGDEEKIGLVDLARTNMAEVTVYSKAGDFEETGRYNFEALVSQPGFVSPDASEEVIYDAEGEIESDIFRLCLPDQFNKIRPKFVTASFNSGKFPLRIYKDLPEDKDFDFTYSGWLIKGSVEFEAGIGNEDWWIDYFDEGEVLQLYGQNITV
ncbi:MAG: hypothetical protein Q4B64_02600, partial [Spirochaetales bacterium]|nr:hypothetical protein [Spirochaetales bacterium]